MRFILKYKPCNYRGNTCNKGVGTVDRYQLIAKEVSGSGAASLLRLITLGRNSGIGRLENSKRCTLLRNVKHHEKRAANHRFESENWMLFSWMEEAIPSIECQ